jgi:hypothetical protein
MDKKAETYKGNWIINGIAIYEFVYCVGCIVR